VPAGVKHPRQEPAHRRRATGPCSPPGFPGRSARFGNAPPGANQGVPRVIDGPLKILLLVTTVNLFAVVDGEGVSGYAGAVQVPMGPRRSELHLPGLLIP
jgi:hypothetical protein